MRGAKLGAAVLALGACAGAKVQTSDAAPAPVDASPDAQQLVRSFSRDRANGLGADLATLDGATVETWGAVEPIGWYTGGLVAHASDTGVITDAAATSWATVAGFPSTGRAAIVWSTQQGWGTGIPPGLGLTDGDDWTIWAEGELRLEAGTWSFALAVDDHALVELAPPGSSSFVRVVSADWPTNANGTFVAPVDGWYPFRYANSDHTGGASVGILMSGPSTAAAPIARDRLRARADALTGLVEVGFDDARGTGDSALTIDAASAANVDWGMGMPADLGVTASDTFGVRWSGQLRLDVGGTYTFRYASDDGQRLWIDGAKVLDAWGDVAVDDTSAPMTLTPGWHDVVIDHSENTASAAARLTIASGPELAGMPLPPARLRPIEGRAERIAPATDHADVAIADNATVESPLAIDAPAGAAVTAVDLSYEITHGNWGDLVVTLRAPDGTTAIVRDRADAGTSGDRVEHMTITSLAGHPAAGTWTLFVQDAATGSTGTLLDAAITPHYAGGAPPFPRAASASSVVHDLGDVVAIDRVSWTARVPTGAAIAVRVRTCAEPSACASAAWSAPIPTSGGAPEVTPARWLQYAVDFTGDGDHEAALESITIDYRTRD